MNVLVWGVSPLTPRKSSSSACSTGLELPLPVEPTRPVSCQVRADSRHEANAWPRVNKSSTFESHHALAHAHSLGQFGPHLLHLRRSMPNSSCGRADVHRIAVRAQRATPVGGRREGGGGARPGCAALCCAHLWLRCRAPTLPCCRAHRISNDCPECDTHAPPSPLSYHTCRALGAVTAPPAQLCCQLPP